MLDRRLHAARRYGCGRGGAGVRPWRIMISAIFAPSGGPPAAAFITSAASRKYCGPSAAGGPRRMVSSDGLTWRSTVCAVIGVPFSKLRLLLYTVNAIYFNVKTPVANPLAGCAGKDADRRPAAGSGPDHSPPDHQRAQRGRLRGAPRAAYGGATVSRPGWDPPWCARRARRH